MELPIRVVEEARKNFVPAERTNPMNPQQDYSYLLDEIMERVCIATQDLRRLQLGMNDLAEGIVDECDTMDDMALAQRASAQALALADAFRNEAVTKGLYDSTGHLNYTFAGWLDRYSPVLIKYIDEDGAARMMPDDPDDYQSNPDGQYPHSFGDERNETKLVTYATDRYCGGANIGQQPPICMAGLEDDIPF